MARYSFVEQPAQQFALWRQDALQAQGTALGGQQAIEKEPFVLGGMKNVVPERFELLLKGIDDRNVGVDLVIQQLVEQHGRAARQPMPRGGARVSQALSIDRRG